MRSAAITRQQFLISRSMTGLFVLCLLVGVAFGLPCCECADNDGSQIINCCGTLDISENSCYCDGEPCEPCTPVGEGDCTYTTVAQGHQLCRTNSDPQTCCIVEMESGQNCCTLDSLHTICLYYSTQTVPYLSSSLRNASSLTTTLLLACNKGQLQRLHKNNKRFKTSRTLSALVLY